MDDKERDETVAMLAGCITDLFAVALIGIVAGATMTVLRGCLGM